MILRVGVTHQRTLIRNEAVRLLTNRTSAAERVFSSVIEPFRMSDPPVLGVYTLSEQIDPESASTAPRELTRELKLEIVGWVADSQAMPIGDAMDQIASEIESVMDADSYPPLSGLAGDVMLESTTMEIRDEGDPIIGIVALTYSVTYRTFVDTEVAIDDLLRVGTTTQVVGGVADTAPITDLVTVQETPP